MPFLSSSFSSQRNAPKICPRNTERVNERFAVKKQLLVQTEWKWNPVNVIRIHVIYYLKNNLNYILVNKLMVIKIINLIL